ncbi:MAG: type II toxin-antitoxin system VapB family antitoxin [Pseudomonadota bacterium]
MPLYIRDEEVDALADQLKQATGAPSKTDAVRRALRDALERETSKKPLLERLAPVLAEADAMGPTDPDFDMKRFTDEMWEN